MSNTNLFLPRRIKVGFQKRDDTYTGQLAYVIYFDEKGTLRKEAGFESWRDQKIEPKEFDNEPTDGFVLNKKVGGTCWHGNMRRTYVRVFDPRGFEFEITIPNLLYILENTSSIKGKGLEGKFVYGWDGTDLVLVPVDSPDYAELVALNNKRFSGNKIYAKDLKVGTVYLTKDGRDVVYLGKYCRYGYGYKLGNEYFISYDDMARAHDALSRCDYEWVADAPQGDEYFFSELNDPAAIFTYKSVPGKLIAVSETQCRDYAERYDALEHDVSFSQRDPQNDKIVDSCREAFISRMSRKPSSFAILVNENVVVIVCDYCWAWDQDGLFKIRLRDRNKDAEELLTSIFGTPDARGWTLKYEDAATIYDKLHVVHIDRYLKNGKVYKVDY